MTFYIVFSAEGNTDHRFIPIVTEKLLNGYFLERNIEAEYSWHTFPKSGSSEMNIIEMCKKHSGAHVALFHRDAGNVDWKTAYENHFADAVTQMSNNENDSEFCLLVPIIPVREIEAWMLVDKDLLKRSIGTNQSNNDLGIDYKQSRIEEIGDPKATVEHAVNQHHQSLPKKVRKYAVQVNQLYDIVAADITIEQLRHLDSFCRFESDLYEVLDHVTNSQ